jgi:hypothetical protein
VSVRDRDFGWTPAASRFSSGPVRAFSLIEILVTIGLLSFIILGLVAMFVQTQRAFKVGLSDTDMLETGRALSDMMARELAEMRPTQISNTMNFYVEIPQPTEEIHAPPLLQGLPGITTPPQLRTNYLEPFFFMSQPNQEWPDQTWVATGYYVVPDNAGVGLGALYRYSNTNLSTQATTPTGQPMLVAPNLLFAGFASAVSNLRTNNLGPEFGGGTVSRVADGIIHMRVRLFATNGFPILGTGGLACYCTNPVNPIAFGSYYPYRAVSNTVSTVGNLLPGAPAPDNWVRMAFYSNAVPAYVEMELGVLDSQTYQRFKGVDTTVPSSQTQFLSNRVAQVHVFRQRIPIHNVDTTAY